MWILYSGPYVFASLMRDSQSGSTGCPVAPLNTHWPLSERLDCTDLFHLTNCNWPTVTNSSVCGHQWIYNPNAQVFFPVCDSRNLLTLMNYLFSRNHLVYTGTSCVEMLNWRLDLNDRVTCLSEYIVADDQMSF